MYFSFFLSLLLALVYWSCHHFTYIVLDGYIYMMMMYVFFSPISPCVFSFLSLYICFLCMQSFISVLYKMPWWVLFKVFQKDKLLKSTMPWTLFLQSFSKVCVRVRFCCVTTSSYELSDLRLLSWLVVLLWFCHGLPKREIIRDIFM